MLLYMHDDVDREWLKDNKFLNIFYSLIKHPSFKKTVDQIMPYRVFSMFRKNMVCYKKYVEQIVALFVAKRITRAVLELIVQQITKWPTCFMSIEFSHTQCRVSSTQTLNCNIILASVT